MLTYGHRRIRTLTAGEVNETIQGGVLLSDIRQALERISVSSSVTRRRCRRPEIVTPHVPLVNGRSWH